MPIDPVVVLVEELRSAEAALQTGVTLYERDHCRERGEAVNFLISTIKSLNSELLETVPTSALGAAVLIRLLTERLPFSHARYADHFCAVANRLSAGQRTHTDLIWLRAMDMSFASSAAGEPSFKAAPLLQLAIFGAARPVVIFRAVTLMNGNIQGKGAMARLLN